MKFTDKDLKRLKELFKLDTYVHRDEIFYLAKRMVNRLEAAESLVAWSVCRCGSGGPCHCGYWEKKEAWRESSGK